MTMSAADFLERWFETEPLKATIVRLGHHRHLPRRALTGHGVRAAAPLHGGDRRRLPGLGHPQGRHRRRRCGHRQRRPRASAPEIRTERRRWRRCSSRDGRATGVVLESGEEIEAGRARQHRRAPHLPAAAAGRDVLTRTFEAEVRRFRFRGSSGKVNLALDGLPSFTSLPGPGEHLRGAMSFSPSLDYMERAYDDAKAGRLQPPALRRRRHPHAGRPDDGAARQARHELLRAVRALPPRRGHLGRPARGLRRRRHRRHRRARAQHPRPHPPSPGASRPSDMERDIGLTEGNIFQGELSLEQLFFNRPVPGWSRFRTPLRGLWLAGSSAHPGGGIMGANGRLAALEVLGEKGRVAGRITHAGTLGRHRRRRRPQRPRRAAYLAQGWPADAPARAAREGRGHRRHADTRRRVPAAPACSTPSVACAPSSTAISTSARTGSRSSRPRCAPSHPSPTAGP